jgi:hypothetical protein
MRSLAVPAVALSLAFLAAPAQAAYDRDGPYLDYSTTFALGAHGHIPNASTRSRPSTRR